MIATPLQVMPAFEHPDAPFAADAPARPRRNQRWRSGPGGPAISGRSSQHDLADAARGGGGLVGRGAVAAIGGGQVGGPTECCGWLPAPSPACRCTSTPPRYLRGECSSSGSSFAATPLCPSQLIPAIGLPSCSAPGRLLEFRPRLLDVRIRGRQLGPRALLDGAGARDLREGVDLGRLGLARHNASALQPADLGQAGFLQVAETVSIVPSHASPMVTSRLSYGQSS